MVQPSKGMANWAILLSRLFIGAAILLTTLYLGDLIHTVNDQKTERNCLFELSTETDKIDSDIAVKQAQIFEAAILRPGSGGGTRTEELIMLGNQLHDLIKDRGPAYTRRAQSEARCNA